MDERDILERLLDRAVGGGAARRDAAAEIERLRHDLTRAREALKAIRDLDNKTFDKWQREREQLTASLSTTQAELAEARKVIERLEGALRALPLGEVFGIDGAELLRIHNSLRAGDQLAEQDITHIGNGSTVLMYLMSANRIAARALTGADNDQG